MYFVFCIFRILFFCLFFSSALSAKGTPMLGIFINRLDPITWHLPFLLSLQYDFMHAACIHSPAISSLLSQDYIT